MKHIISCRWSGLIVLVAFLCGVGCAEVKPWQRGYLAKPEMQIGEQNMSAKLKKHVYFSKEGSTGGDGFGGGGCGCN